MGEAPRQTGTDPLGSAFAIYGDVPDGVSMPIPEIIADAGERAGHAALEFFTARIPNAHTRKAYGRGALAFCGWCERERVSLAALTAPTISADLEGLRDGGDGLFASVKVTASAIRPWLDFLTERGVLGYNPARSARTERLVVREGKTPVFSSDEGRKLFAWLDAEAATSDILALRDRALMAAMLYGFVRIGAVVGMRLSDFEDEGEHASLVLCQKVGKEQRIACQHKAREYLRAYVRGGAIRAARKGAAVPVCTPPSAALTGKAVSIDDALRAVKRPYKAPASALSRITRSGRRASPFIRRTAAGPRMSRNWPATPTTSARRVPRSFRSRKSSAINTIDLGGIL
jgi:integrase/recombinase XerC